MDQQAVNDICQTIQAAQELLDSGSIPGTTERPSKKAVAAVADKLKTDVAKVGVVFGESSDGSPSPSAASSLLEDVQQTTIALYACCQSLLLDAGATLKGDLAAATKQIAGPLVQLIQAAGLGHADKLKQHIGQVWQGCDELKKCPLDNRAAIFKHLASTFLVIKDTLRELKELHSSAADGEQQEAAAAADDDDDGLADLDEYEVGDLSEGEAETVAAACEAVEATGQCLKAVSRVLLEGPPLLPGEALDGWESTLFHCSSLRRVLEDLGAALYPPQEEQELGSAAAALLNCVEVMLDECPELDRLGSSAAPHQGKLKEACARIAPDLASYSICEAKTKA